MVPPRVARATEAAPEVATSGPPAPAHWRADPLFPGKGHGSLGLATGVPFVAMAEAAYAPSERFALGAIVGATPNVLGLGVRPRASLPLSDRTRISLAMPVLYYPTGEGLVGSGAPWFLAQPAVRLERRLGDRGYGHVGAGVIGAVGFPSRDARGELVVTYNDRRIVEKSTPWGIWNTVGGGAAIALGERTVLFGDAMLVMRGLRLAGDTWIGGPPFAFTVGVARVL